MSITEAGETSLLLGTVDVDCSLDVETLLHILVTVGLDEEISLGTEVRPWEDCHYD